MTLPISGTGSAGMECTIANLIKSGDSILIGVNGYFRERMVDMAGCYGAIVHLLDKPCGDMCHPEEIDAALRKQPAKVVAEHPSYRWWKAYDWPNIDQPRRCSLLYLKH